MTITVDPSTADAPPLPVGGRTATGPLPYRMRRLPPLVKLAVGVGILVVVGVVIKDVVTPGPPARCIFTCASPPTGPYQPNGEVFTSEQFGFSFQYPGASQSYPTAGARIADLVYNDANGNFFGQFWIAAGTGTSTPASLIAGEASHLSSQNEIENLQDVGPMLGAEVGFQPAVGEFYSGEFPLPSGDVYVVDLGIVALQHDGDWIYMVAISTVDSNSHDPNMYSTFDDILDRWRWSS